MPSTRRIVIAAWVIAMIVVAHIATSKQHVDSSEAADPTTMVTSLAVASPGAVSQPLRRTRGPSVPSAFTAPEVPPPPFRAIETMGTPPKECTLSNFAAQVGLAKKFLYLCQNFCFPRRSAPNSTLMPRRPSFCFEREQFTGARFDFSQAPQDVEVPANVPLILCALGQRFFGPGGQSYVLEAIRQWRLFHSAAQSPIYLIVDEATMKFPEVAGVAATFAVELVASSGLMTPAWRRYFDVFYVQGYMHPGGSRTTGNTKFNQLVSERFFAVQSLMEQRGLRHVIHLENDIMVYANLMPQVAAAARCGYGLATTIASVKGFIPSVVYIRDAAAMKKLVDFINDILMCGPKFGKQLQPGYANDMTYTLNFYEYFGSRDMGVLPSWEHEPQQNCIFEQAPADQKYMFDAASFGQWLSFAAKENAPVPPLHIRNAMRGRFVDATPPPVVTWEEDVHGRRVPRWKNYTLVTLHIHAKNLELFRSMN